MEANHSPMPRQENDAAMHFQAQQRPSRRGLFTVIAVIIMLVVAGFVVHNQVFKVREVEIRSIHYVSYGEVLELAGIGGNTSSLSLSEEKMRKSINSNIYLDFQGFERVGRNKIIIYVNERTPVANVLYNGLQFVASADGMVLSRSNMLSLDNGYVTVSGLNLRDIRVSSKMVCQNEVQLEAYTALLEELQLQGILKEVAELNFSSLDSIYLVTVDGYTVNLGNQEDLRGKIGTMRAVVKTLRDRGLKGGMVEATVSGVATYRPND